MTTDSNFAFNIAAKLLQIETWLQLAAIDIVDIALSNDNR